MNKIFNPTIMIVFMIVLSISAHAQTKEICITLDDLPVVSYDFKGMEFKQEVTQKLINTFDKYDIPAIGFVNEKKLYSDGKVDSANVDLLRLWLKSNYELGNHSFSHKDYHKVSYEAFTEDVLKGEEVCRELVREYNSDYHYFRHPYLHIGLDKNKHDSLTNFLAAHDYLEAPVTIDNDDYIFAYAYSKAMFAKDKELMMRIGKDYVNYMEQKLLYFEQQSVKLFDRNMKHILLLHANAINADYLDELAELYQLHGYNFVSMSKALADPAYQTSISKYGTWGISWIDRWALSQGKKGDFFAGDPVTPDYVKEILRKKGLK